MTFSQVFFASFLGILAASGLVTIWKGIAEYYLHRKRVALMAAHREAEKEALKEKRDRVLSGKKSPIQKVAEVVIPIGDAKTRKETL